MKSTRESAESIEELMKLMGTAGILLKKIDGENVGKFAGKFTESLRTDDKTTVLT